MRSLKRLIARVKSDRGAALPFIAVMVIVLIGMAAFAVDLGWMFLQGTRLQRAADSAALAGVVYLPSDVTTAGNTAVSGANANGWDIGTVNGSAVSGGGPDALDWAALQDNKMEVTLTAEIPTFFLKVFGIDQFQMSRTATAEYVKPVPLGSPANCFGIGNPSNVGNAGLGAPSSASAALTGCKRYTQNFWAAMNGRRTALENGDPYGVACITGDGGCSGTNGDYRPSYYFGVDIPAGQSAVDLYVWDFGFYDRDSWAEAGDEESLVNSATGGTDMRISVYNPDGTPVIPYDNTTLSSCSAGANPTSVSSGASSSTYKNRWVRICRITPASTGGLYVLKVENGSNIGGTNQYAILADSNNDSYPTGGGGTFPRIYAINDMGIFTNDDDGDATIWLAEVDDVHAGKVLEVEFFDPGEGAGNAYMTLQPPSGQGPVTCTWAATDTFSPSNPTSGSSCTIQTTVSGAARFNSEWLTVQIDIPTGYDCDVDAGDTCYWTVNADLNTAHDRTTWTARVIGNPVRLVPNT